MDSGPYFLPGLTTGGYLLLETVLILQIFCRRFVFTIIKYFCSSGTKQIKWSCVSMCLHSVQTVTYAISYTLNPFRYIYFVILPGPQHLHITWHFSYTLQEEIISVRYWYKKIFELFQLRERCLLHIIISSTMTHHDSSQCVV